MNPTDRRKIRENYVELVRNLMPENVLDYLYQEHVLSEEDCENVRSATTRAQRVRLLLAILPRKPLPGAMEKFIESLERAGYVELVGFIRSDVVDGGEDIDSPTEEDIPWTTDSSLSDLKEQLEQQAQVVESMQQEMEQLQHELKRYSESFEESEKYKKTVAVLGELELEKAKKEQYYDEVYEKLLKDMNKAEDETDRASKASTMSKSSKTAVKVANFRTPSFTLGGFRHYAKIKCVLVGDGGTGKTSIIHYLIHGQRLQSYVPTVFDNRSVDISNGSTLVTVNFWDTAGQEGYDRLRPLSYADAHIAILVFSVASQTSLNNVLAKWQPEVRHFCKKVPVILVGNKTDHCQNEEKIVQLRKQGQRWVERQEADMAARVIKAKTGKSHLCSAYDGEGMDSLRDHVVEVGLKCMLKSRRKKGTCSVQ